MTPGVVVALALLGANAAAVSPWSSAWAWVLGSVVGLGAVAAALTAIAKAAQQLAGWVRCTAWPWVKRAVRLVNLLTDLPATLSAMQADWAAHILVADTKMRLLDSLDARVSALQAVAEDTRAEVKNNGGGSLKDSAHRIEQALGLPAPSRTPVATGPIPTQEAPRG